LRPRLQFCAGDAHRLEWANNTFDGCLVMSTFMHIQSPKQALREMVRVLKRGGRLVALEPDWDTLVMTVGDATVSSIIVNAVRQSVRHSGIAHELPVLFRQAGLQPVKVEAGTTVVSEYTLASDVWRIAESLNHACQSEIRGSYKTRGLLLQLNRASKKAEFFAASTGFAVCGRKP
jgi:SAM-dependent methyltransferase